MPLLTLKLNGFSLGNLLFNIVYMGTVYLFGYKYGAAGQNPDYDHKYIDKWIGVMFILYILVLLGLYFPR